MKYEVWYIKEFMMKNVVLIIFKLGSFCRGMVLRWLGRLIVVIGWRESSMSLVEVGWIVNYLKSFRSRSRKEVLFFKFSCFSLFDLLFYLCLLVNCLGKEVV